MTQEIAVQDGPNAGQITYWNDVAGAKWVANQDRIDRLMGPLTDALLAAAAPRRGESVIEIGTGCGDLALRTADLVGKDGHVLAADISRPMLAHAEVRRQRLPPADRAAIEWRHADAMIEPFEPAHDLLISRFGIMFFDDRPRAFANLRKTLRAGGRFAFLTWRRRPENEWMQAPLDWMAPVLPVPEEVPDEIGPYALADADKTHSLFATAGFTDLSVEPVDCQLLIGAAPSGASEPDREAVDDALIVLTDTGPGGRQLRDAEPAARAEALKYMRSGIERHVKDGRVVLGGACWIYRGRA